MADEVEKLRDGFRLSTVLMSLPGVGIKAEASGKSGESGVCDLTGPLELGQPTVSHRLKILVEAGLLHREKPLA